jgi:hypothetical protein
MTHHANHHNTQHEPAQHGARFSVADSRRGRYAQPQSSHPLRSVPPVGSDPRGFFTSPGHWLSLSGLRRRACIRKVGERAYRGLST